MIYIMFQRLIEKILKLDHVLDISVGIKISVQIIGEPGRLNWGGLEKLKSLLALQ